MYHWATTDAEKTIISQAKWSGGTDKYFSGQKLCIKPSPHWNQQSLSITSVTDFTTRYGKHGSTVDIEEM